MNGKFNLISIHGILKPLSYMCHSSTKIVIFLLLVLYVPYFRMTVDERFLYYTNCYLVVFAGFLVVWGEHKLMCN